MALTVTFNIANSNGRTFSILTENKNYINSVITVGKNNEITQTDIEKLQRAAAKNGDAGVLENCDLNGEQKLNLANAKNFGKYYDITLSDDGKLFKVKIKDAGKLCMDPNLATIKSDFGIRDNVLVKKGSIPYGNEDVIPSSTGGAGYDSVTIEANKTINIPVAEINITGTPQNAFGRFYSQMTN